MLHVRLAPLRRRRQLHQHAVSACQVSLCTYNLSIDESSLRSATARQHIDAPPKHQSASLSTVLDAV